MIQFYLGRSGVGKSYRILEEIKHAIEEKKHDKLILIVPEQYTLQGEIDLIRKMDLPGLLDFEVISFNRLISRVIETLGGLQTTSINTLGKTMLLRKIFNTHHDQLSVFARAYKQYGFLEEVSETIAELKRARISSELLFDSADKIEKNPLIKGKLQDLSLVYSAYEEGLEGKYTDDEDKINYVLNVLEIWSEIRGARLWIDGFSGFTAQEYQLIYKLSTLCERVTIALTTDLSDLIGDADVFANTRGAFETIRDQAKENGIPFKIETLTAFQRSKEIKHLEKNFFSYPYISYKDVPHNVVLQKAKDKKEELEWVASEIIHHFFHKGYRWKDMMVVVSDVEIKVALIQRIFNQFKIPYFIDMKQGVLNNGFVRFVQNSLQAVLGYYKQKDVLEVLKSGFVPLTQNQMNELENYVLKMGIEGRKWLKWTDHDPSYIGYYLKVLMAPLQHFYKGLKKAKTVEAYVRLLLEYLEAFNINESLEKLIENLESIGHHELALAYAQIWNKFIEVIDQLVEIAGQEEVVLREFMELLSAGFTEMELGIIPPKEDLVTIGSINRSKSHEVKMIFLTGVNDGEIPKSREEYGLLSNEDKTYLVEKGFEMKSTLDFRNREEVFNLYQILSKPSEKIIFSYCDKDSEGKTLRPSLYINKLRQVYSKLKENPPVFMDTPERLIQCGEKVLLSKITGQLKDLIEGKALSKKWMETISWIYNNSDNRKLKHVIDGYYYTNQVPTLMASLAKDLYETPLTTSTSKLERYVECPYAFFVRYGLNPRERALHEIKLPDIGVVFHEALEKFGQEIFERQIDFMDIEEGQIVEIVTEVVDDFIRDYGYNVFEATHANKYLVAKIKRVVKRAAWAIIEQLKRGTFEPKAFEVEFSNSLKEDTVPPIVLTTDSGHKILLEGRIDRVDVLEGLEKRYVKIIDYKSSSKSYNLSDVYHGLQMQLMIYMDAVLENSAYFREEALYPCGAFYFKIDDPIIEGELKGTALEEEILKKLKLEGLAVAETDVLAKLDQNLESTGQSSVVSVQMNDDGTFKKTSKVVDTEDFMNIINHVKIKISEIGEGILSGNIGIEPVYTGLHKACDYCSYKGLCQFDPKISGNSYRRIKKYKDAEVLEKIKERGGQIDA